MTQPEPLRLADAIDYPDVAFGIEAAAELRRLSIENERIGPLAERVLELKAQRDALLEALKDMLNAENTYPYGGMSESEIAAIQKAHAAIKAVEENT